MRSALAAVMVWACGVSAVDAASLTIEWDPPADGGVTVGYVVSYGNAPGAYTARMDVGYFFKYRVDGLLDATTYCFSVQAYNSRGELSDPSSEVCAKTAASSTTPPPASGTTPSPDGSTVFTPPSGSTAKVAEAVLHAAEASVKRGHWSAATSSSGAGGRVMRSTDSGFAAANAPLASPANFFEMRFEAQAKTPYRIWVRLRAGSNSKWNDSVWVQFSDAVVNGGAAYRIGTTSGLAVNLQPCNGCAMSEWGWNNSAYWLSQPTTVTFAESGTHTIRIQTREDGVEIDQIVLSAAKYMSTAPGPMKNDTTLLPTLLPPPLARTPYTGTAISLPGTIEAAHVDQGSAGIAYADTTAENLGASFRATDVDVQPSSLGGFNIGWADANEWVAYSVNVTAAGTYTVQFRVASVNGGTLHVSAGAPSSVANNVTVPKTGAWQKWTTVSVPLTLSAGPQVMAIRFLTAGVNLRSITVR